MAYLEKLGRPPGVVKHRAVKQRGGPKGPSFPTEIEARRWAIAQGWLPPVIHNLNQLVQAYVDARLVDEAPITVEFSRGLKSALASVFRRRKWESVSDVTLQAINTWRVQTKGKGVRRSLAYLLAVLRWGVYHLDVAVDPKVLAIKLPRRKSTITARLLLSPANVSKAVREAASYGPHVHGVIHYLATYGARPVTACRLRVGAVNFRAGTLTVEAKHSGEWIHPLRQDTLELFAACAGQRDPEAPLFLAPKDIPRKEGGRPFVTAADGGWLITKEGEAESLARWYHSNIGKEVLPDGLERIYHLKRYAITTMLDRGMNLKQIAEFTGHLTPSQILEYARTSKAKAKESVDLLPEAHRAAR